MVPWAGPPVSGRAVVVGGLAALPILIGAALLATAPLIGWGLILATLTGLAGLITYGVQGGRKHVVSAPNYLYQGVAIEGASLDILADTQRRFLWAERMFSEVPTGIRWAEVANEVDVLLWEAAGHAAKVSAIDVELGRLHYATDGTPQAALRRRLQRERRALWARLEDTQYEADDLAREASNTAAAARMALSRSGSVLELEVVAPSGADLLARGTLAAARARLALLAEVWAELDETTELTSERLELDP